jgi:hypothetical protein
MNVYRSIVVAFASIIGAAPAQALEPQPAVQIQLVCPDRSPRMSDITLAVSTGYYRATQAQRNRMLERARSVCAAGLSVVSLIPPNDVGFANERALVSDTKD